MEEHHVITKTTLEMVKRVFRGKRMKIHKLEKDNENLRKAFARRIARHGNLKATQDLTEYAEPASFGHGLEEFQKFVQETPQSVCHEYSEPSNLNHAGHGVLGSPQEQTRPVMIHSSHQSTDKARGHQNDVVTASIKPSLGNSQQVKTQLGHNPVSCSPATEKQISASNGQTEFPQTATGPPSSPLGYPQKQRTADAGMKTQHQLSVQQEFVNVQSPSLNTPIGPSLFEQKQFYNSQQLLSNPLQQPLPYPHYPAYSHIPHLTPSPSFHNSHYSNASISRSFQSNQAPGHQSFGPLNMDPQTYPKVPQQTFPGQISSHHQPPPYLPVPYPSYSRHIPNNQQQNHHQTLRQAQFDFNHNNYQTNSQPLQKQCSIEASSLQPQAFMEGLPQSYPISKFPCPGIQNESLSQGQQHQPHNNASQQEHDHQLNLSSCQSFKKQAIQTQSQFDMRPDALQGKVLDPKYQLFGENVQDLSSASKEVLPSFECGLSKDVNTNQALSDDEDNEGLGCQIVYENLNITRHQNSYKTFPITQSENGYQTGNCSQTHTTPKPFSSSCLSIVNTNKTCSLPLVMTPPLTPPTHSSSTSVQLNSNTQYNVTSSHDSNSVSTQNLHTSQSQPLSIKNHISLSQDSSKKPVELDALEKSKLNSVNSSIPEQICERENGEIPIKERDSLSDLDSFSDLKSRHLSLTFSDIIDADVSRQRAKFSLEDSVISSSEELSLSQNSSLVSSVSQSVNNKTSQTSSTSDAMINTSVKTTEENKIANSPLDPCGELKDLVPTEKSEECTSMPSINDQASLSVPSVSSAPFSTGSTDSFNDFQSDVTKIGFSPEEKSNESMFPSVKIIPESLATFCFVCRKNVKGRDILLHLIFGHLKCKMCDLTIKSCQELRESDGKETPCKNGVDKNHDFSVWYPNPIDFLCFQIWQHSHTRKSGAPSSGSNLLKMYKYLKVLKPLCNVKPWNSAFRKCQQYASKSKVLDSNKINSSADTGINYSKENLATEKSEDKICRSNNDLLSRVLIEAEIGMENEEEEEAAVNVSTISVNSEYDLNTVSDEIETSRGPVNSESCSTSISLTEESCKGSASSELSPISTSAVKESSICSANSKSIYNRTSAVGEVSKGLVISEPCSTSTSSVMVKSSEDMIDSKSCNFNTSMNNNSISVNAEDRFVEGKVQTRNLSKEERKSEEEKENVVVKSSGGKLMEPSVIIKREEQLSKDFEAVKEEIPEINEIEENVNIIQSEYLVESSCSIDHLDVVTEYVTLCNDISGLKSSLHHCRGMSEEEHSSIDEISNRHSQSNALINSHEVCDSQSLYDGNSNSQNLYDGGVNSLDIGNLEMTKNEKCKPSQSQSDGQAGRNQSDRQAGQNQSNGQAGRNQSDSQAGRNQSDRQAGQNQSNGQAGRNQSDSQAGRNQSDDQADQNQSDGQAGRNQSDGQAGQNQSGGQAGQNQSDGQASQDQSSGQAIFKVSSKDNASLRDFLTLNNPSPQKQSKLLQDENHLIINFQAVDNSGLANVKCPEECPLCYTVLCPSRFRVNLKSFHLTTCCIECGLYITITLGDCKEPSGRKKICKRLGPKSKTGPLVTKKLKLTD